MDEELIRQIRNPDLEYLEMAKKQGIYEPLVEYIEKGGELHPETREWLGKLLRGKLPSKKPGDKRRQQKVLEDWKLLCSIRERMQSSDCTENAAIEQHCAENAVGKETVKTRLRRMSRFKGLGLWPGF